MELLIAVCGTLKRSCVRARSTSSPGSQINQLNSTKLQGTYVAHMRWYTLQHKGVDNVQDNGDNGGQAQPVQRPTAIMLFNN